MQAEPVKGPCLQVEVWGPHDSYVYRRRFTAEECAVLAACAYPWSWTLYCEIMAEDGLATQVTFCDLDPSSNPNLHPHAVQRVAKQFLPAIRKELAWRFPYIQWEGGETDEASDAAGPSGPGEPAPGHPSEHPTGSGSE